MFIKTISMTTYLFTTASIFAIIVTNDPGRGL